MAPRETRDGISFGHEAAAGAGPDDSTLTYELNRDGTVTGVSVRIYSGAETDLKIGLFVYPDNQGNRRPLVEPIGKNRIDGDDDVYSWSIRNPVQEGDTIVVEFENQDGANPHAFRVNMDVDYGPIDRLIQRLSGVIS